MRVLLACADSASKVPDLTCCCGASKSCHALSAPPVATPNPLPRAATASLLVGCCHRLPPPHHTPGRAAPCRALPARVAMPFITSGICMPLCPAGRVAPPVLGPTTPRHAPAEQDNDPRAISPAKGHPADTAPGRTSRRRVPARRVYLHPQPAKKAQIYPLTLSVFALLNVATHTTGGTSVAECLPRGGRLTS